MNSALQRVGYNGETTNCPFSDATFDQYYNGDSIVEVVYNNNGQCVGTDGSGYGHLGACGDIYGNGAANGHSMCSSTAAAGGI
jgi:hypothetical protein